MTKRSFIILNNTVYPENENISANLLEMEYFFMADWHY